MALIAAGCAKAAVPHDWKQVDVQDISFYAPPDLIGRLQDTALTLR
jgi:hypothetical protein